MENSHFDPFEIETRYQDEFGQIDPQILSRAKTVWQKSGIFFSNVIQDHHHCFSLLLKATAIVSEKNSSGAMIKNPSSYLYTTFRHLVMAELKRQKRHSELEIENGVSDLNSVDETELVFQKVLVGQIRSRMDEWTRAVFDSQVLGYLYKDLVPAYGSSENVIRSRYSKNLAKLKNEIFREISQMDEELTGKDEIYGAMSEG